MTCLPKQQGKILKPKFLLLNTFLIIITLLALQYFIRFIITPHTGLINNYPETVYSQGQLIFSPGTLFSPAVKAGLLPGRDTIIQVNGILVTNTRELIVANATIKNFTPFPVTVIRDNDQRLNFQITPQMTLARFDWIFHFFLIVILIYTSIYLIYHYPYHSGYNFVALACTVYLLVICIKPFFYENIFSIIFIHIGTFAPWLLIYFCLHFPKPKGNKILRRSLMLLIFLTYALFSLIRIFYMRQWFIQADEIWFIKFRNLGKINNIVNGLAYLLFILLLIITYKTSTGLQEKYVSGWFIIGFIISLSIYFCIEELPLIFGEVPGERISSGNLTSLFLIPIPLFFLAGLKGSFKFYSRSIRSGLLLSFFTILLIFNFFFLLYQPVKSYFISNNGFSEDLASFAAMLLLFLLLFPINYFSGKFIRRIFYRKKFRNLGEVLENLLDENEILKMKINQISIRRQAEVQQEKKREFDAFTKGITSIFQQFNSKIKKSILMLEQTELFKKHQVSEIMNTYDLELFKTSIDTLRASSLFAERFTERLNFRFNSGLSVKCDIDIQFIIQKAVHLTKQEYPDSILKQELIATKKINCCPEEIIQSLVALLCNSCETARFSHDIVNIRGYSTINEYCIKIEDNGTGILPMHKHKVFSPFFSTKKGHDGLGLFLAKLYLEKNEGHIEFKNKPTGGCIFTIILPGFENCQSANNS